VKNKIFIETPCFEFKVNLKYVNYFYNWETRTQEWIGLLKSLEDLSPKIPKNILLNYS